MFFLDLLNSIAGLLDTAYTCCQHLFPLWLLPQKIGLVFMPYAWLSVSWVWGANYFSGFSKSSII